MDEPTTDDEARQFAEATLLDVVRGDAGDFKLTINLEAGLYSIELTDLGEPDFRSTGTTFAEAWLATEARFQKLRTIRGGKA